MTYAREMAEKAAASIIDIKHTRADVLEVTIKEVIDRCAVAARDAVNSCRIDGESDLRSARARAEYAILGLYSEDTATPVPTPTTVKETT